MRTKIETTAEVRTFNVTVFLFDEATAGLFDRTEPARVYAGMKAHPGLQPMAGYFRTVCLSLGYQFPE